MFNHIERKIVKAAKTPDRKHKQQRRLVCWMFKKQQHRRQQTQTQKENSFYLDPNRVGKVFHVA